MQAPLVIAPENAVATLPVMETFYSVQGEGFHSGKPAFFIRLGGCDVGCTWCDVKESWDQSKHPEQYVKTLHEQAAHSGAPIAVITGGEPAMYDLNELTRGLAERGIQTHLETSGAYPLSGQWHWICFSPKKFKKPLPEMYQRANELKVVVYNKHDLQWALEHAQLVGPECKLFLQPEWSRKENVMPLIADFVRLNTEWRISLQTHKYMNLP
ncbi:MAG: 7-carboxy-7-deazaguanine synthase QueE [Cryomorphaceae bacterium]|nr:MAG: 7-carboxy-7-deazaguanine synthase QueE [Cryomorphaceae bacterium]